MGFLGKLFKGEGAPDADKVNPEDKLRERIAVMVNRERKKHGLGPVDAKEIPGVSGGTEEVRAKLVTDGMTDLLDGLGKILSGEIEPHTKEAGKVFIDGMITYGKALAMKYSPWLSEYGEEIGFTVSVGGYAWHGIERKKYLKLVADGNAPKEAQTFEESLTDDLPPDPRKTTKKKAPRKGSAK